MKFFKRRNFLSLLLALLLLLPFIAIISRVIYVQSNHNAFESYGGIGTLDNVFEYSLSTFITANEFGKIDFFSWFSNIFLDNTIHDNLYIHFINWYLNYSLYVSLSFLLFHILYFVVDLIRRFMDRSSEMI